MRRSLYLLATLVVAGCSTDLEVNAPYKENTIVYGLLNMRDSVHMIKVNKAFLGEGDARIFAQIRDSNEYRNEDITMAIVNRIVNGQVVATYPLHDTIVNDREPGTFYAPTQKLFYFTHPSLQLPQSQVTVWLDQNSDYELVMDIRGRRISSLTPIVNDFSIQAADQSLTTEINLITGNGGYGGFELNWTSNKDGKRYEASYRFNFSEIRGTDTTYKSIDRVIGTRVASNSQVSEPLAVYMEGELFYSTLASAIPNDPTVTRRIFTGIDFLFTVANDDFHTFLSLSEPISSIVEERPAFSNVENALGIFGSRFTKSVIGKRLNGASLNELINGPYTSNLNFCSGYSIGPPYGCP